MDAIDAYKRAHSDSLTDEQFQKFQEASNAIATAIGQLNAQTAIVALEQADASIAKVKGATAQIQKALQTISDINTALTIVTAVVGLASSLLSGNPQSILQGIQGIVDVIPGQ
jgi:hypothetical protein